MRTAIEITIATFLQNRGVGVFMGLVQSGDPELVELIREKLLRPRMELGVARLRAGSATGQVRPDADVDTVADLVLGAGAARLAPAGQAPPEWSRAVGAMTRQARPRDGRTRAPSPSA